MHSIHVRPERELRNNFSEISKLNQGLDAVILTNRGKGSHVLLSFEEFAEYEEFLTAFDNKTRLDAYRREKGEAL